jgi:AcrR family transcriptional regulator
VQRNMNVLVRPVCRRTPCGTESLPAGACVKIDRMAYPAKISRAVIVNIALQMVEESGAEPPSLRAIARRLNVATNALYNYFPDRADLNAAIALAGSRKMLAALKRAIGGTDAREALDRFSKAFLRFTRKHPALYDFLNENHPRGQEAAALFREWAEIMNLAWSPFYEPAMMPKVIFAHAALLHGMITLERLWQWRNAKEHFDFANKTLLDALVGGKHARRRPSKTGDAEFSLPWAPDAP